MKRTDEKPSAHFDKCISNDFPFLLWVGSHIQSLADAFPWRPVLVRDGERCCPVVEGVSGIYHWIEQHFRGERKAEDTITQKCSPPRSHQRHFSIALYPDINFISNFHH